MEITYKSKKLQKICTNAKTAEKEYGVRMSELIHQRIDQIQAADSVELLIRFRIGRCHLLKSDRHGQYAMDLVHPYRLVFEKHGDEIQIAHILEIVDYH
ncbi:MAG: type II toxin-antitoxin system RelE/ParE family toxin [Firmicutes bacterium]|nr:type II toxin-antitoxin system RelE/ParE family toxin [Bacillota bacterium]